MSTPRSRLRPRIALADVLKHSGLNHTILDFARFNGFSLASSDLSFDERADRLKKAHPEMDNTDVLVVLGDDLKDEVNEFFNQVFPVVKVK